MIITYGAFCSNTLDKNYIPVVLKYLELYILTYRLDDVLSELSKNSNKTFVKTGKSKKYKIQAESENINNNVIELCEDDFKILTDAKFLTEANGSPAPGTGNLNKDPGQAKPAIQTAPRGAKPNTKTGKVYSAPPEETKTKIGDMNRGVVSLEPTWIQVTYNESTFMLGVKVVPIYFKDEEIIVNEILQDLNYKQGVKLLFQQFKRFFVGSFRRLILNSIAGKTMQALGWEIFDKNKPDGIKIKNKVIYATTSFVRNTFMVLNKNSFSEDMSEKSYKYLINTLSWCSLIFMDDVNQQASFCMKMNKGRCSVIPYRVLIHSTMNKTMGQAYQEIDEVQSAVSSVFRMNQNSITKIFGEMEAAYSLIDIRQHLNETLYLQENAEKYISNPDLAIDMFKKVRFISKMSDLNLIQDKLSNFPTKLPSELNSFINKNSKNFKKLYNFAYKVLKNSIQFEVSDNDLEILSYVIAYRNANMRGPNQIPRMRDLLKDFIRQLRKNDSDKLDKKVVLFRTIVDVFNDSTSILKYHDFDDDNERQKIIVNNLYVFLSLVPLIVLK